MRGSTTSPRRTSGYPELDTSADRQIGENGRDALRGIGVRSETFAIGLSWFSTIAPGQGRRTARSNDRSRFLWQALQSENVDGVPLPAHRSGDGEQWVRCRLLP